LRSIAVLSRLAIFGLPILAALAGCGTSGSEEGSPPGVSPAEPSADGSFDGQTEPSAPDGVEIVHGGWWVVPVEVDGIGALSREVRDDLLSRVRAARAADGILRDQLGPEHRRIVGMLDLLHEHGRDVPARILGKVETYRRRFLISHGNRDPLTGEVFRPRFIPGELAAAAQSAVRAGARLDTEGLGGIDLGATKIEELEALLAVVRPWIFGDRRRAEAAGPDSGLASPAADPDLTSALRDLYAGRGGDGSSGEGLLGIRYRRSQAGIGVAAGLLGGLDPRGCKDPFGAMVFLDAPDAQEVLDAARRAAARLERSLPSAGSEAPAGRAGPREVRAVVAVLSTGALGPVLPAGTSILGDGPMIETNDGRIALFPVNLALAADRYVGVRAVRGMSADAEVAERRERWRRSARLARIALEAALAGGTDGTEGRPKGWTENRLGDLEPVVSALRRELAALYVAPSPLAEEIGVVPGEECARAIYDDFVCRAIEQRAGLGDRRLRESPSARAVDIAISTLVDGGAVEERPVEGGGRLLAVADFGLMRDLAGRLLAEVRRIRYHGDRAAAEALCAPLPEGRWRVWRRAAMDRWRAADLPRGLAFSYPDIEAPSERVGDAGSSPGRKTR